MSLIETLVWRWVHLGRFAAPAIFFYVFPVYLDRGLSVSGLVIAGIILCGYGNIKYFLLALLFWYPLKTR